MIRKILCVDDEPNILLAFRRQLRQFDIETATGGAPGLEMLQSSGPFAAVVSDLRMPHMDGVRFLSEVKRLSPDTVRIMLTGQADLVAASEAVNQGNLFRLLLKPCPTEVLTHTLDAALEHHRLMHAERELLEQTLRGAVEVLTEVMSLVNPEAFGRAHRMRRYVERMASCLNLPDAWQFEMAAMLSEIGSIAVTPEVLQKVQSGEKLSTDEQRMYTGQYRVAHNMIAKIPRLGEIALIVLQQGAPGELPEEQRLGAVYWGAALLRAARWFDELLTAGKSPQAAILKMRSSRTIEARLVDALATLGEEAADYELGSVRISQLAPGMILRADVRSKTGQLLLGKGLEITPSVIARLRGFANSSVGVVEPIAVRIRA